MIWDQLPNKQKRQMKRCSGSNHCSICVESERQPQKLLFKLTCSHLSQEEHFKSVDDLTTKSMFHFCMTLTKYKNDTHLSTDERLSCNVIACNIHRSFSFAIRSTCATNSFIAVIQHCFKYFFGV